MISETKTLQSCYVGIDISSDFFEICFLNDDEDIIDTFQIHPDRDGFIQLLERIPNNMTPEFGMEATGKFANNLVQYLGDHDQKVIVTNAFLVARLRDVFTATIKNDATDAWVIARGLKMGILKHSLKSKKYQHLQNILEYREDLIKRKTMVTNQLRANLVEIFPEIGKVFSDICGNASLAILEQYPTPSEIQEIEETTIRELILSENGKMGYKKIKKLQDLASNSVGSKSNQISKEITIAQVRELKLQKQLLIEVEETIQKLSKAFERELKLLQSVPGVADKTSRRFLAIVGNIQRFQRSDDGGGAGRVLEFVGFGLREYSSGSNRQIGGISKRGNGTLRGSLYMAAMSAVRVDSDLKHKYEKYAARSGSKKKALVAIARTLVRRMYGVLKSGTFYDPGIPVAQGSVAAA